MPHLMSALKKHAGISLRSTDTSRNLLFLGVLLVVTAFSPVSTLAQTGGEAGIQGTVTDSEGAAIPNATVVVTNNATGVALTRKTTGDGLYTVSPILPGTYTVKVQAAGFSDYLQKNLTANALAMTPLNISMKIGAADTTVEVTEAPPQLVTTNATLGLTVENTTYANLPLALNGQQRDPTYVAQLSPGATAGARLPIIGGTGNYLGQLYLDGLPAQTVSQQGDNRLVSQAVTVDAIDQIQVVTSTPPVEYAGAGASNFTMKSGGLKYHGSVKDFIRNTSLDAWPFVKTSGGQMVKPVDHQNELAVTIGGHVPGTKRVFFFFAYDRYHNRTQRNSTSYTIPSVLQRQGDFTELNGGVGTGGLVGTGANNPAFLFDPTSTTCSGGVCTRRPFQGIKNGVPTNNVIPDGYISPIAKAQQQFLPDPTNSLQLVNNYTAGLAQGFDNHLYNYRVDFQMTPNHRISTVGAMGTVNYVNNFNQPYLPLPYTGGTLASIFPKVFDIQDAYTISNTMVNQLKFGYVRFFQNITNPTQNEPTYQIGTLGITNLPAGQAGQNFPAATFGSTTKFGTPIQTWQAAQGTTPGNASSTQQTTPNNFALVDNLQWVRGAHTLTFGITIQWQQINNANPATYTGILNLPYNANSTAQFANNSSALNSTNSGYSYASFLLGAVSPISLGLQPVSEVGGRYRTIAPYVGDTWKVTSKLTIDAGLRWDYLPPYREVKDRWSFMNPNLTNPATGTPGAIQFAGDNGGPGVSCNCRTPVQTYWKNWGPRVGVTFSPDDKTVFRAGIGRVYSQGGGVGGRGGAFNGTGQLGFNTTATSPAESTTGASAGPSFYLNNSSAFQALGLANTSLFGPGYAYPSAPVPGAASQSLNAGNYLRNGKVVTAGSVSYADPYFSGRAPNFMFYNVGMQRALTNNMTLGINYVGNQSHHLINSTNAGTGSARGYWTNQLNPIYLAGLGSLVGTGNVPLLLAPATAANVAKAQAAMPGIKIPGYFQAAAESGYNAATIAQGLVAFPQYSGVSDTWGNVGNFSYNSLQVTVEQRLSHGLTFQFNYTWSRNVGDDGSFRSGFDIPAAALSGGGRDYHQDRIERSQTLVSSPHVINGFGVWSLPFGKDHIGGSSWIGRALGSGWQLSGIYTYQSGTPAAVTYGGCNSPGQGQCMPDLNPAFAGNARINGGFGTGPNGRTACNLGQGQNCTAVKYFDTNGFKAPSVISPAGVTAINLIGNAPRTGALHLTNPGAQNVDTALKRSFGLPREGMALAIEVDCFNTWNHTIFSNPNAVWGSAAFGTIGSVRNNPRAFELAGHFTF
ncbi:TonB-dependent receptor [Edaphobacter sp. HDX4]|uniref:carboxypeptidase regulatory-like domain-containing protein n=1 Tax=Edaphobacter sp. HDX4 TaxID=2794064 RepID=UPI002FE58E3E